MNLRHRIIELLKSMYGNDQLNIALFCLYLLLSLAQLFFKGIASDVIISTLQCLLLVYAFFRMFSKNIYKRKSENDKFMMLFNKLINRAKQLYNSVRYRNRVLYRTCPKCRARLRMTRKRGKHTVKCPLCNSEFVIRIL